MQAAAPLVILWTVLLAVPPACHADMEINPFEDPGVYSDCSLFTRAPTRVGAAIGGVTGMALGIAAIPLTVPFWVLGHPAETSMTPIFLMTVFGGAGGARAIGAPFWAMERAATLGKGCNRARTDAHEPPSAQSFAAAGRYHGTVLDADTGQPIEGASVVIVWYRTALFAFPTGDAPEHLHAVRETVTDASGRFAVSAWRDIDWNPSTHVKTPIIVIYEPGYEPLSPPFTGRRGFHSFEDLERKLRRGTTIHLPRLKKPECQRDGALVTGLSNLLLLHVPSARVPHLFQLINSQRERCGFKALPQGEQ